jgi:hypothetical protein
VTGRSEQAPPRRVRDREAYVRRAPDRVTRLDRRLGLRLGRTRWARRQFHGRPPRRDFLRSQLIALYLNSSKLRLGLPGMSAFKVTSPTSETRWLEIRASGVLGIELELVDRDEAPP